MDDTKEVVVGIAQLILAYFVIYMVAFGVSFASSYLIDRVFNFYYRKRYGKAYQRYNFNSRSNDNFCGMTVEQACKILGIKKKDLKKMTKDDLKKAYRAAAMKHHPDHGGDEEVFKNVSNAFSFMSKEYNLA